MVDAIETCSAASYVLTKIPLITKKVFSYLPAKSLNSCARFVVVDFYFCFSI